MAIQAKKARAPARTPAPRKAAGRKAVGKAASRSAPAPRKRRPAAAKAPATARAAVAVKRPVIRRPPSLRGSPRAGGAPEIMVALNNEHRHIASLLEALAEQSDNLLPGRKPDYALMRDIARYMANFPDEYHHPREDLLFARLVARDAGSRDAVEQLLEGHQEIYRRSRELLDALTPIVDQGAESDDRNLKYLCDRYIGYYWDHINMEEGQVFPRATAKLRQEDWFAVNSEAKYVDDPLFGDRVRKEYQRLSKYLSTRMERVTEDIAVAELFGVEALVETVVAVGGAVGEIRGILGKRLRATLSDCLQTSGKELRRRELGAILRVPGAMASRVREHAGEGAREMRGVVSRARAELAEPFATRMRFFRKMVD